MESTASLDVCQRPPVLIIGAGIAGLVLGHALKKNNIPFVIFERDTTANSRLQGWALTIHFCLPELLSMLEDDVIQNLDRVQVDPGVKTDKSDSIFINLADCSVKWRLPPGSGTRKRVNRDQFRQLLINSLHDHILWNKKFVSCSPSGYGVTTFFEDGSKHDGLILVGVDGAASRTRSILFQGGPSPPPPTPIPVHFLGTSLKVKYEQVAPLIAIDRILFQGCHPQDRTWMWFSVIESPESNGTINLAPTEQVWKIQLCLSWLREAGDDESEIPCTDKARVLKMREKSQNFHPTLRAVFHEVLDLQHTPILSINLVDWCLPTRPVTKYNALATLAGDAAHTMAMYRGEGFNHSIIDVYLLSKVLSQLYDPRIQDHEVHELRMHLIRGYEEEVRNRGSSAVSMCREACMEVHQWEKLDSNSTVRKKRIL